MGVFCLGFMKMSDGSEATFLTVMNCQTLSMT